MRKPPTLFPTGEKILNRCSEALVQRAVDANLVVGLDELECLAKNIIATQMPPPRSTAPLTLDEKPMWEDLEEIQGDDGQGVARIPGAARGPHRCRGEEA